MAPTTPGSQADLRHTTVPVPVNVVTVGHGTVYRFSGVRVP